MVKAEYEHCDAKIEGYVRCCVKGEVYPGLIKVKRDDEINGRLYFNVTKQDLARLDHFEGEYYRRELVTAMLEDGRSKNAIVYLFKNKFAYMLDKKPWDRHHFEKAGLSKFISDYQGFMRSSQAC